MEIHQYYDNCTFYFRGMLSKLLSTYLFKNKTVTCYDTKFIRQERLLNLFFNPVPRTPLLFLVESLCYEFDMLQNYSMTLHPTAWVDCGHCFVSMQYFLVLFYCCTESHAIALHTQSPLTSI